MARLTIAGAATAAATSVMFVLILQNQPMAVIAAKIGSKSIEYQGFLPNSVHTGMEHNSASDAAGGSESVILNREAKALNEEETPSSENKTLYSVIMYPWNNHLGRPAEMEWSEDQRKGNACREVPTRWQGKIRSVNTNNNCIVIFARTECRGSYRILKPGSPSHNRLSDLCFQKKPLSARPCKTEEETQ